MGTARKINRVTELFQQALALSPAERRKFLEEVAATEPHHRAELEALVVGARGTDEASGLTPLCATDLLEALTTEACHQRLLSLARRFTDGTSVHTGAAARCPLCRYPTSEWAVDGVLSAAGAAIRGDFPDWSPSDGSCTHCAEHYEFVQVRNA